MAAMDTQSGRSEANPKARRGSTAGLGLELGPELRPGLEPELRPGLESGLEPGPEPGPEPETHSRRQALAATQAEAAVGPRTDCREMQPAQGLPDSDGGVEAGKRPSPALSQPPASRPGAYASGPAGAKPMTPEEERVLIEHLPIVRFLARRIHERLPQHVDIDDLFSAGVVGLMDAFAKFDSTKKVQFRSYAQFRIRGAILDSLRTLDWSPRELRRKGRAVEEAIRTLTSRLGRAPSECEVAIEMGTSLEVYQQLLGELKGLEIGTLHLERNEDSGEEELAYIPGRSDDDPLFRCLRREMGGRLTGAIQDLPDRERLVMTLYYYEEMTMREIGMALGVVESRVSQIHASAVLHLRSALSDFSARGGAKLARPRTANAKTSEAAERIGSSAAAMAGMRASH